MNNKNLLLVTLAGISLFSGGFFFMFTRKKIVPVPEESLWIGCDSYIPDQVVKMMRSHHAIQSSNNFNKPISPESLGTYTPENLLNAFKSSKEEFYVKKNGVELKAIQHSNYIVADIILLKNLMHKKPLEMVFSIMDFQKKMLKVVRRGFKYEYLPLSLESIKSFGSLRLKAYYQGDMKGFKEFLILASDLMSEEK